MNIWRDTLFGEIFMQCEDSFTRNLSVPYRLRAQLDFSAQQMLADNGFDRDGQMRFGAFLFRMCAMKTYPIWEKFVGESEISDFDLMIDKFINKETIDSDFLAYLNSTNRIVQNRIYEWDERIIDQAGVAGMSCVTAMAYVLNSFSFDQGAEIERDTDTSNWDCAFLSSIAEAGGAEWQAHERDLDNEARTQFWRWYLECAIPQSIDQAMQSIIR